MTKCLGQGRRSVLWQLPPPTEANEERTSTPAHELRVPAASGLGPWSLLKLLSDKRSTISLRPRHRRKFLAVLLDRSAGRAYYFAFSMSVCNASSTIRSSEKRILISAG